MAYLCEGEVYEPAVTVYDRKFSNKVEIKLQIMVLHSTKNTGQGTGLGLSLSYDIVKAHGGELKVETKEEEGAAFVIQLPA